jgi:hypothetical protein
VRSCAEGSGLPEGNKPDFVSGRGVSHPARRVERRGPATQIITEDQYVPEVIYGAAQRTLTRESIGTRYVLPGSAR